MSQARRARATGTAERSALFAVSCNVKRLDSTLKYGFTVNVYSLNTLYTAVTLTVRFL